MTRRLFFAALDSERTTSVTILVQRSIRTLMFDKLMTEDEGYTLKWTFLQAAHLGLPFEPNGLFPLNPRGLKSVRIRFRFCVVLPTTPSSVLPDNVVKEETTDASDILGEFATRRPTSSPLVLVKFMGDVMATTADSTKRVALMVEDRSQWVTHQEARLRIIPQALWERVRARQAPRPQLLRAPPSVP